ncbi:MAG: VOC family protein [Pseudomonas sp.]
MNTPHRPSSTALYLTFSGNCREALQFYAEELGGTLGQIHTYRDAPDGTGTQESWLDKVMHGEVTVGDQLLMGSDAPPDAFQPPQGLYIQLYYDDLLQAEQVYNRLSDGGVTQMPFGPSFWARGFGMLIDRFGIGWMVNSGYIEQKEWP